MATLNLGRVRPVFLGAPVARKLEQRDALLPWSAREIGAVHFYRHADKHEHSTCR